MKILRILVITIKKVMTYRLYKPLRNHLRKYSAQQSLAVIRAYFQHLQFDIDFPQDIQVLPAFLAANRVNKNVYEWELELLVREVIINSSEVGELDMRRWNDFSSAVNKIKQLENSISGHPAYRKLFADNVLQELFRISHRQFQWQKKPNTDDFMRYFKIFDNEETNAIIVRELGLSARQISALGLALTGMYQEHFGIREPVRVELPGLLTQEQADMLICRFSIEYDEIRQAMIDAQSYDQDFAYTLNPLLVSPLIWVLENGQRTLIAPIPTYVLRRFTEGIYYEIFGAEGFAAAFGASFQDYVGQVIAATTVDSEVYSIPEEEYLVGRDRKDSIDWIFEDPSSTLFIECKTKRVRYECKLELSVTNVLDNDLDKMADFVVQAYKTLSDALDGRYRHWQPNERQVYPMVVTLEEWYSFGDRIISEIDRSVTIKLRDAGLDAQLQQQYPYSICSMKDFEYAAYVMSRVTIAEYMARKNDEEYRFWSHGSFCWHLYAELMIDRPDLFDGIWNDLIPEL